MKFRAFIRRDDHDESWRFEGEPEDVIAIGETLGCGCCSSWEAINTKNLAEHIASLEKELEKAKKLLEEM